MGAHLKHAATLTAAGLAAASLGACGTQGIQVSKSSPYRRGAELFLQRCSGCHTLATVGAEGSATSIKDRVRTNGPNFNFRKEQYGQVLFAIRNGGFSGAIMPQNIVVGAEAQQVAAFLAKYSGLQAPKVPSIEHASTESASSAGAGGTGTTPAGAAAAGTGTTPAGTTPAGTAAAGTGTTPAGAAAGGTSATTK